MDDLDLEAIAADPEAYEALCEVLDQEPANWIASHCRIVDKHGALVWLSFNDSQLHTEAVIHCMEETGLPVRLAHLKARQHGETTRGLARQYERICRRPNRRALVTAHDNDASTNIFGKVQMFQEYNPDKMRAKYSSRKELAFGHPHNSSILVHTAGKEKLGRSATYDEVHVSEAAFIDNAETVMLAVNQCVPTHTDTSITVESTANGMGGYFYDLYCNARTAPIDKDLPYMIIPEPPTERWNGYYRVFHPWFVAQEYRMPAPHGFVRTDKEKELAERYGLDDAQLYWRRWTINEKCNGSVDMFNQEYPATDLEAFLVSGRPVFEAGHINRHRKRVREPRLQGIMVNTKEGPELQPNTHLDWVKIWDEPRPNIKYAIGADTAEGLDPEESNDPDANSAHVFRCDTGQVVAKIKGQMDPAIFGEQLDLLGRFYNDALVGVEINSSSGGATRQTLKYLKYPNLFFRRHYDKIADEYTLRVGWETNQATRMHMLTGGEGLAVALRRDEIRLYDGETLDELATFVYDKVGKPRAMTGKHDDDVMSLAIGWQMVLVRREEGVHDIPPEAGEWEDASVQDEPVFNGAMLEGGREGDRVERDYTDDDEYY